MMMMMMMIALFWTFFLLMIMTFAMLFFQFQDELSKMFGIRGIPTLVILDGSTGKLVTMDGRSQVRPGSGDFNFK